MCARSSRRRKVGVRRATLNGEVVGEKILSAEENEEHYALCAADCIVDSLSLPLSVFIPYSVRKGKNCMLTVARPLDAPACVPLAQSSTESQPDGLPHPFGLVFARRERVCLSALGMTNATANGTTSNDGSEEFDWIDDD